MLATAPAARPKSVFSGVLLALIVFFIVVPLGSCVACLFCAGVKKGLDESKIHAGDGGMALTAATASAAPVETAAPEPTTVTVSAATFTKDTLLDECMDFSFPLPEGTDASAADVTDRFAKFLMSAKKSGMSRIYKPCAEQFQTNAALATCTAHLSLPLTKADAGPVRTLEIDSVERYYNLDNLTQSNAYMKDCLDMKGDWQGLDKDSDAYREAVRARARREMEKLQKSLGQ